MNDNDEDNDGKFPDESPVEFRYPARSRAAVGRKATRRPQSH
jgi:hypothetical protein